MKIGSGMMEKDVFISFSSADTIQADRVKKMLEDANITVWISYEGINGGNDYSIEIPQALKSCTIFLLLLSPNSCQSINVAKELSLANTIINRQSGRMKRIIPVMIKECNYEKLEYYLTNIQILNGCEMHLEEAILQVIQLIQCGEAKNILLDQSSSEISYKPGERISNKYYTYDNEHERMRLELQQNLFKFYDQKIYDKIAERKTNQIVLDVGSSDGKTILDRLDCHASITRIIALEQDEKTVTIQNEHFQHQFISFYQVDVESDNLKTSLQTICERENIEKFDVIHISMLLLHLKSPLKMLRILKSFLKSDGVLMIKDIDDGFNIAYPDEGDLFKKAVEFYEGCEEGGYRHSGRQIYSYLKKLHMNHIQLELNGINTMNMDYDQRNALYELYFAGCIKEDMRIMSEKYQNNPTYKKWYHWFIDNENQMQEEFFEDSFFFNLGILIFTCGL